VKGPKHVSNNNGAFWRTENAFEQAKLLRGLVGAWGFEPQTPTVSTHLFVTEEANKLAIFCE